MPIAFDVYTDLGLFVTRYLGKVTDEEFRAAYARIRPANAGWRSLDEIADMRAMSHFAVDHGVLRAEAEITGGFLAMHDLNVRCAVVAPEDLPFALSRVYGAHADFAGREEVQVFRDPDSAADWLGVPATTRQKVFASRHTEDVPQARPVTARAPSTLIGFFRATLGLPSKS